MAGPRAKGPDAKPVPAGDVCPAEGARGARERRLDSVMPANSGAPSLGCWRSRQIAKLREVTGGVAGVPGPWQGVFGAMWFDVLVRNRAVTPRKHVNALPGFRGAAGGASP